MGTELKAGKHVRAFATKAVSLFASAALVAALAPAVAPQRASADDEAVSASGTSGTCTWTLEDGVLTLSPTDGTSGTLAGNTSKTGAPWYEYYESITSVVVEDGVATSSEAAYLFNGLRYAESIDVSGLDVSDATDIEGMFRICSELASVDVSGFDTSNVNDMNSLFINCSSLTTVTGLSGFDTSKVTDMSNMFGSCNVLEEADVSGFDTSNVTSMGSMFVSDKALTELDVSGFDTSKVTDMASMFSGCSSVTELDVSKFDTSRVTSFNSMFRGCSSLSSLDVSGFSTSRSTTFSNMFYGLSLVPELDVSGFSTGKASYLDNMFHSCSSVSELDLSNFSIANVYGMDGMFDGCTGLRTVTLGSSFGFYGDECYLPAPVEDSTSGNWRASSGYVFDDPSDIPSYTADTYTAVFGEKTSLSKAAVKLSSSRLAYNGKARKPKVTVTIGGHTLKSGTDYTASYASGSKNIGSYKVTVKGKGHYSGSVSKSYKVVPQATKVKKATAGKRKVKVTLVSRKGGVKYQVRYKVKGKKKWKTVTAKKAKVTLKKLRKGKKYLVQARTMKKVSGKTYTSSWSASKVTKKVK